LAPAILLLRITASEEELLSNITVSVIAWLLTGTSGKSGVDLLEFITESVEDLLTPITGPGGMALLTDNMDRLTSTAARISCCRSLGNESRNNSDKLSLFSPDAAFHYDTNLIFGCDVLNSIMLIIEENFLFKL
jgi:hypothetical protein